MKELEHDAKIEPSTFASRYILEKKLGVGGMGAVYKGWDKILLKPVAIKVLLPNSQADAIIRFHREAKMAARLSHANILNVLDFGQNEDGDLYLVMDFLDGESLHERLKSQGGALHLAEALSIFLQICAGLYHAHSQGILHRDIKPSNIMLVEDERGLVQVKIVDFGLAKVEGAEQSLTTTGTRVGSPLYMSPEQAQTENVDQRSDIYSLGVLMYKTLTGKVPLAGDSFLLTLNMHVNEIPNSINDVSPDRQFPKELADIVAKTLEKDPDDRYQTAQELAEALMGLDLSFLTVPLPAMSPAAELQEELLSTGIRRIRKNMFGVSLYVKVVFAVIGLGCAVFAWKALSDFLSESAPSTKIEQKEYVSRTDTDVADIVTDKLDCRPDGSIDAHDDFADENMHELLKFKQGQTSVSLKGSQVTGTGFATLREMKKLKELDLSDTKIDDKSLEEIGKLKKLTALKLEGNKIGDIGIQHLSGLNNLKVLHLQGTQITNLGLEPVSQLESLEMLDISGCKNITGAGLDTIAKLDKLVMLGAIECPNIKDADLARFRASKPSCRVHSDGKLNANADKKSKNNERQARRVRWRAFMRYRKDIEDPEFKKFFERSDAWKSRTSYDDIKNPRIVACLKDAELQEIMKDPEARKRWNSAQAWEEVKRWDERINKVLLGPLD